MSSKATSSWAQAKRSEGALGFKVEGCSHGGSLRALGHVSVAGRLRCKSSVPLCQRQRSEEGNDHSLS